MQSLEHGNSQGLKRDCAESRLRRMQRNRHVAYRRRIAGSRAVLLDGAAARKIGQLSGKKGGKLRISAPHTCATK